MYIDIEASQRELINDLMSWIFQNKLLYTGPSGVEQFSNALLLHLQSLSSSPSVSTGTGLMYNQVMFNYYVQYSVASLNGHSL